MNIQKVLLGTLLVQPEFAPYVLPVLEISDFEPDIQPIFAAAQGFWTATGKLETVQLCIRYPALKAAIMGCADEYSAECIHIQYAALASNGPVHTRPLALQELVGKNPKPT